MIQVSNNMHQFSTSLMTMHLHHQYHMAMQFNNSMQMQLNHYHNRFWQPWLPSTDYHPVFDEARPLNFKCKDVSASSVSGGKWKRERKGRHILVPPPDYASHQVQSKLSTVPEPLDMSRKARGSPPPYTASLASRTVNVNTTSNSNSTSSSRASVIISSASTTSSPPLSPTGSDQGGSSDPVIDEHFRRSLGADYLHLYKSTSPSPATPAPSDSALSVDDHFAKALGDTWFKLQQAESKKSSSDHSDIRRSRPPSSTSTLSPPTSPLSRHHSPGVVPI